ncbi:tRNA (uracil(54)-C(5))-methyltransferase [Trichomonascus vanleenenianus]|uniref:tRNA (uracil(54)-C(5))-methyltransferase n=1 Tax=Trichomonascus vanleenenianus TaxID=2268995 RepID=UPI003ECB8DB3
MSSEAAAAAKPEGVKRPQPESPKNKPPMKRLKKQNKKKKFKEPPVDPVSAEGVLINDIKDLLKEKDIPDQEVINDMQEFFQREKTIPHPEHCEAELEIIKQSSVGDGLAINEFNGKKQIVVVPYTVVGDKVKAKIYKTFKYYFQAEMVEVLTKSDDRDDSLVRCRYFNTCSGCQYQMIPYKKQLEMKREVIVNAFRHYAPQAFASGLIPTVLDTVGSPKEYEYRTKLTPHFDVPRSGKLDAPPPIGFGVKGRKNVVDIEECVIGTPVVNDGMKRERQRVHDTYDTYKRGATLLLRENAVSETERVCVTSTKEIITEYVGEFKFEYPSSSFFQNNNSILVDVTSYVRDNIKIPATGLPPKYLVDTYCGSGLFAVTCSHNAESVIGVEISKDSVEYASRNAELNNLKNASFIVGQAEKIFEKVNTPPAETSIIIDPPRKGCDQAFLDQLIAFKPAKCVYVSCNVHSQARDIEYLLEKEPKYKVESLRGFDFFPQTHHVEGVAVITMDY